MPEKKQNIPSDALSGEPKAIYFIRVCDKQANSTYGAYVRGKVFTQKLDDAHPEPPGQYDKATTNVRNHDQPMERRENKHRQHEAAGCSQENHTKDGTRISKKNWSTNRRSTSDLKWNCDPYRDLRSWNQTEP